MAKSAARTKTERNIDPLHRFVGSKIRELRGHMPTDDFAKKSGVHPGPILDWEAGNPPSLSILEAMARRHSVEPGFFFPDGRVDPEYPEH